MRIRVLSDLHLEFISFVPAPVPVDVVVLAGDIHVKTHGVSWAKEHFSTPVIYVPGNHEHYGSALGKAVRKLKEAAQGTNVHVLHNEVLVLGGVRFVGATLWTDFRLTGNTPLAKWDASQVMSDYKKIRTENYSRLRVEHLEAEHVRSRLFIERVLATPFEGKTVVVTHHAPCWLSIPERYRTDGHSVHLCASYASNLEHLFNDSLSAWLHGHTHDSARYLIGGTPVICNPRGYAPSDLNPDFDETFVLDI